MLELIPERFRRFGVMPVGRLDKATEGLLLFTNDGVLAHRLISPRSGVWKRYYAEHTGEAGEEDVRAFAEGMTLGDGHAVPPGAADTARAGEKSGRNSGGKVPPGAQNAGCKGNAGQLSPP